MRCAWCDREAAHNIDGPMLPTCGGAPCGSEQLGLLVERHRMSVGARLRESRPTQRLADDLRALAATAAGCADIDGPADASGWVLFG